MFQKNYVVSSIHLVYWMSRSHPLFLKSILPAETLPWISSYWIYLNDCFLHLHLNSCTTQSVLIYREIRHIELQRCEGTFGFSIRGGKDYKSPLCVLKIVEKGAAEIDGRLRASVCVTCYGSIAIKVTRDTIAIVFGRGSPEMKVSVRAFKEWHSHTPDKC